MQRLVLKFGGSSVANLENIKQAAKLVAEHAKNADVVVVVSAMQGETSRLLALAKKTFNPVERHREFDQIMSTGETVTAALMALALQRYGFKSQSLTAAQVGIHTDGVYQDAKIDHIKTEVITHLLDQKTIPVVTGFQGIYQNDITTLGRGGSDLTAIALADYLKASNCWIYTDVQGVYAIDPNIVPNEDVFLNIDYKTLRMMSISGAEVIQYAAIDYAQRTQVPLRIASTFNPGPGTLVNNESHEYAPIIVKYMGLCRLYLDIDDSEQYKKVFDADILVKNPESCLLKLSLTELKSKLRVLGALTDAVRIDPNCCLVTLIVVDERQYRMFCESLSTMDQVEIFEVSEESHYIRVIIPDYKMMPVLQDLYEHAKELTSIA